MSGTAPINPKTGSEYTVKEVTADVATKYVSQKAIASVTKALQEATKPKDGNS